MNKYLAPEVQKFTESSDFSYQQIEKKEIYRQCWNKSFKCFHVSLLLLTFSSMFCPLHGLWRLFLRYLFMKAESSDFRTLKQCFPTFYALWHTEKMTFYYALGQTGKIWPQWRLQDMRAPGNGRLRGQCLGVHLQGCSALVDLPCYLTMRLTSVLVS